jgi:hypothetical protein
MRTPKIEVLHRAINLFNKFNNCSFNCLDLDRSLIDSNSWLAGFTDGDGNFSINLTDRKKKAPRVRLSFKLMTNVVIPKNVDEE